MLRRRALGVTLTSALAVVGIARIGAAPALEPARPGAPNILLVMLDDARTEGVMDVAEVLPKTKRWLVEAGTTFPEGMVTSSLCCPERASVWSGRVSHNHHVYDNYTGDSLDRDWISARYLQDAGYRTALVGKFITDWKFRYEPPHFDDYAVFQGGYENALFWAKGPGASKRVNDRPEFSTDYIAEKASAYIDAYEGDDGRPWFMQVSPHAPHNNKVDEKAAECDLDASYDWPARHDGAPVPAWRPSPAVTVEGGPSAKQEKADKVPWVRHQNFTQKCGGITHEGHMRTLLAADEMVDRIMTRLEATGELTNTLVVLTSDNGWSWDERGVTSKGLPYREHVQVPFVARWDGVFPAGATDPRLVSGEDFLPTYLDAAGYTPPQLQYPLDGRSFLPGRPARDVKLLELGPVGHDSPDGYQGHRGIPTWASLRSSSWQYIEYYEKDNRTVAFREYYDLAADPWQLENLLADQVPANDPDVATLSARLQTLWTCSGTTGANPCP